MTKQTFTTITIFLLSLTAALISGETLPSGDYDVTQDTANAIGDCCEAGCDTACNWLDNYFDSHLARRRNRDLQDLSTIVPTVDNDFVYVPPPPGPDADLELVNQYCCSTCRDAGCGGDPHFTTWTGDTYDFHGQCELVLIDAPSFGEDLGLKIHIRTKIRFEYSYIETAAIKIGDDILEISSWGEYSLNGVDSGALPTHLGSFPISMHVNHRSKKDVVFEIDLGSNQKLVAKTFKDWVSISMKQMSKKDFHNSRGLMGNFNSGAMLARDGKTILSDPNEFGQEWQVRPSEEGQLFQATLSPQFPEEKCILPSSTKATTKDGRRRLGQAGVSKEQAQEACAHVKYEFRKSCAFDVLVSADLEMAEAYY